MAVTLYTADEKSVFVEERRLFQSIRWLWWAIMWITIHVFVLFACLFKFKFFYSPETASDFRHLLSCGTIGYCRMKTISNDVLYNNTNSQKFYQPTANLFGTARQKPAMYLWYSPVHCVSPNTLMIYPQCTGYILQCAEEPPITYVISPMHW